MLLAERHTGGDGDDEGKRGHLENRNAFFVFVSLGGGRGTELDTGGDDNDGRERPIRKQKQDMF